MAGGDLDRAAGALVKAEHVVAFTGAGVSVESGIPDFRSPGGLWSRFDPAEYGTLHAFLTDPEKVWKMVFELLAVLERAEPNPAHKALARLEELGKLDSVITQNVDNLHQEAGSRNVVELHGNNKRLICLGCGASYPVEGLSEADGAPRCSDCGKVLKPDAVFFGEALPWDALQAAQEQASRADVMLVVGTSASVAPANMIPQIAKRQGALIVEVNLEPSELTYRMTDVFLRGSAAEIMSTLVERVESLI